MSRQRPKSDDDATTTHGPAGLIKTVKSTDGILRPGRSSKGGEFKIVKDRNGTFVEVHGDGTWLVPPVDDKVSHAQAEDYARYVGAKVTQIVLAAVAHGAARLADPDAMAGAIADLMVEKVSDPERSEMLDLVAPLWSAERARSALGLSRATMAERRKTGSLLALSTTDGDFFYPVAQFEKQGERVRVKPALRTMLMTLRAHDPWTVAVILNTPADELDGLTPLEWDRQRDDPSVLAEYAEVLDAEWSR